MFKSQNQGVPGCQYNLVGNTNTENFLLTRMFIGSKTSVAHQGYFVVVAVIPWNHHPSDDVNNIYPVGGCQPTIYRRNGLTTPWEDNKTLYHNFRLTYIGPWFDCIYQKIRLQYLVVVCSLWILFVWYKIYCQSCLLHGRHILVCLTTPPISYKDLGKG